MIYQAAATYGAKNLLVKCESPFVDGYNSIGYGNYTIDIQGYAEYCQKNGLMAGLIDPEARDFNVCMTSVAIVLIEMNVLTRDFDRLWRDGVVTVFVISCDDSGEPFYTKLQGPEPR